MCEMHLITGKQVVQLFELFIWQLLLMKWMDVVLETKACCKTLAKEDKGVVYWRSSNWKINNGGSGFCWMILYRRLSSILQINTHAQNAQITWVPITLDIQWLWQFSCISLHFCSSYDSKDITKCATSIKLSQKVYEYGTTSR